MPFPVDSTYIRRTEQRLGRGLPLGYVASITKENGGVILLGDEAWFLFTVFDDSVRRRLKRTCNDLIRETASAREWPDFPEQAVAIANNGAGDTLFFLPSPTHPSRFGDTVYLWDHEASEARPVADDFLELRRSS